MEHISEELWNAPFALVTHEMPDPENPEGPTEPVFNYANKATHSVPMHLYFSSCSTEIFALFLQ